MSEIFKIVFTTVFSGTLVFVLGQIILRFLIEPINDHYKLKGEIVDSLIQYANLYSNPGIGKSEKINEASEVLRQQVSQLVARTYAIKCYKFWRSLGLVPSRADMKRVSANLIGLSNSMYQTDPKIIGPLIEHNIKKREEIEKLLRVKHE